MKKILFALLSVALLLCACNPEDPNVPVASITLNPTSLTLVEGGSQQISAVVAPTTATNKDITWSSDNSSVATVSGSGLVTAVAPGTAHIIATAADGSGKKASCNVTVESKAVPVTSITVAADAAEIWEGDKTAVKATVSPDGATDKSVSWSSDNTAVATVDASGNVTGVKGGTATITATANDGSGVKGSCKITVKGLVKTITLDPATKTVLEGESFTIKATVAPDDAADKSLTWTSSDESVATVKDGAVVTLKAGTATITATANDPGKASASCALTVNGKVKSISFDCGASANVWKGEKLTIVATVEPATATDKTISWKSSNESVATVDANGIVTAVGNGEATITATANDGGGASQSVKVTVKTKIDTITLDVAEKLLEIGQSYKITATINPADPSDAGLTWTSSNEAAVSVDGQGNVTALKSGVATITVTANDGGGAKASCIVRIEKKEGTEDYNQHQFEW